MFNIQRQLQGANEGTCFWQLPFRCKSTQENSQVINGCDVLLTVGSFLLTVEFCSLTVVPFSFFTPSWSFLLTVGALEKQLELFCLQWERVSEKHLNGL